MGPVERMARCDICGGSGKPTSEKPCICGGVGTQEAELQGFKNLVFELENKFSRLLCEMLVSEAKKCKTSSGAILLLSLKSFLNGESQFHPPLELWQVADKFSNNGGLKESDDRRKS